MTEAAASLLLTYSSELISATYAPSLALCTAINTPYDDTFLTPVLARLTAIALASYTTWHRRSPDRITAITPLFQRHESRPHAWQRFTSWKWAQPITRAFFQPCLSPNDICSYNKVYWPPRPAMSQSAPPSQYAILTIAISHTPSLLLPSIGLTNVFLHYKKNKHSLRIKPLLISYKATTTSPFKSNSIILFVTQSISTMTM